MPRATWRMFIDRSPSMREFRHVMFNRLMPNLRGSACCRIASARATPRPGCCTTPEGAAANQLTAKDVIRDLNTPLVLPTSDARAARVRAGQTTPQGRRSSGSDDGADHGTGGVDVALAGRGLPEGVLKQIQRARRTKQQNGTVSRHSTSEPLPSSRTAASMDWVGGSAAAVSMRARTSEEACTQDVLKEQTGIARRLAVRRAQPVASATATAPACASSLKCVGRAGALLRSRCAQDRRRSRRR